MLCQPAPFAPLANRLQAPGQVVIIGPSLNELLHLSQLLHAVVRMCTAHCTTHERRCALHRALFNRRLAVARRVLWLGDCDGARLCDRVCASLAADFGACMRQLCARPSTQLQALLQLAAASPARAGLTAHVCQACAVTESRSCRRLVALAVAMHSKRLCVTVHVTASAWRVVCRLVGLCVRMLLRSAHAIACAWRFLLAASSDIGRSRLSTSSLQAAVSQVIAIDT